MLRGRAILFLPVMLAVFPVIYLYAESAGESVTVPQLLIPLGIVITATLIGALCAKLVIKDWAKASVTLSIVVLVFFYYGFLHDLLTEDGTTFLIIGRHRYLVPISAVLTLIAVWLTLRFRGNFVPLIHVGTATVLLLVAFNVARIGWDVVDDPAGAAVQGQDFWELSGAEIGVDVLPDIYYIILDGYARADVLQEIYGFDNSEFVDFLTQKGFYVADQSRTNYVSTGESIAASLNMRYLIEGETYPSTEDHALLRLLKSVGYKYVHVGSGHAEFSRNKNADIEILFRDTQRLLLNEFSVSVAKHTIGATLAGGIGFSVDSVINSRMAKGFNYKMEQLGKIHGIPGPTFTFSHHLPPHRPFIFDQYGNFRGSAKFELIPTSRDVSGQYVEQLIYVNKSIEAVVEEILERSTAEPVIIIQGDHGPAYSGITDFDNPSDRFIFERVGILNAYYLPERCRSGLYPTISPVNSFRMVFDNCLGTQLGLLEDQTFWFAPPAQKHFVLVE